MTANTERRLREMIASLEREAVGSGSDDVCEALSNIAVDIEAILDADAECVVGGEPPVPGVGWSVEVYRNVFRVNSVCLGSGAAWEATYEAFGGWEDTDSRRADALYLPGAPANRPCWRRA